MTREGRPARHGSAGRSNSAGTSPTAPTRSPATARLWLVDEKANRAASRPSPYFQADKPGVDLLALIGHAARRQAKELLAAAKPAEQTERDGRKCDVYRWETAGPRGHAADRGRGGRQDASARSRSRPCADPRRPAEPICRLAVVARNKPVNEDLFVVGDTLTEDGRIGKVTDVQGIVTIRPAMADRWSPLAERDAPAAGRLGPDRPPRGQRRLAAAGQGDRRDRSAPARSSNWSRPRQIRLADGELQDHGRRRRRRSS